MCDIMYTTDLRGCMCHNGQVASGQCRNKIDTVANFKYGQPLPNRLRRALSIEERVFSCIDPLSRIVIFHLRLVYFQLLVRFGWSFKMADSNDTVRVAVRIRPLSDYEIIQDSSMCVSADPNGKQVGNREYLVWRICLNTFSIMVDSRRTWYGIHIR